MKTKLAMIAVIMAIGAWLAVGDSPRVRSTEQRVAELEQIVANQSQQLTAQQQQIERFSPLADVMDVFIWFDGTKIVRINNADLWLPNGWAQFDGLTVTGDIYCLGSFIQR